MHMGQFFAQYKTYIFILLGVIIALGAWWGFSKDAPSDSLLVTQNISGAAPEEKSLVDTLLQLRAVSLSGTIFSDPAFMSLRDFGTQIVPEAVGRPNPFAPLSEKPAPASSGQTKLFEKRPN